MIKVVLFDLDGTLLPLNQDVFMKEYFKGLATKLAPHGYDANLLIQSILGGVKAMTLNDGSDTNEMAFWKHFSSIHGEESSKDLPIFTDFYRNEFQQVQKSCSFNPKAKEVIDLVKAKGLRVALATNPLFPAVATESRIKWAGLTPQDFEVYTTYENSRFCKPNTNYYLDIVNTLGVQPEECLMVGNDVAEDMVASTIGMKVFLLTDCLLNIKNLPTDIYPQGGFDELIKYINNL